MLLAMYIGNVNSTLKKHWSDHVLTGANDLPALDGASFLFCPAGPEGSWGKTFQGPVGGRLPKTKSFSKSKMIRSALLIAVVGILLAVIPRKLSSVKPITSNILDELSPKKCKGMNVVITGSTAGVGFEAGKVLDKCGANLIVTGRSIKRAERAASKFKNAIGLALDLTDESSIVKFAKDAKKHFTKIDSLVLNAGLNYGYEYTGPFLVDWKGGKVDFMISANHIGHFLLVNLLQDVLEASKSRLVVVSSVSHFLGTKEGVLREEEWAKPVAPDGQAASASKGFEYYGDSKLMNVVMGKYIQKNWEDVSVVVCTPGFVATSIGNADRDSSFKPLAYIPLTRSAESGGNVLAYSVFVDHALAEDKILKPYWIWRGASVLFKSYTPYFINFVQEIFLQKFSPDDTVYAFRTSDESQDKAVQDGVWKWSKKVVGL